jgi:hypothetical protein
MQKHPMLSVKEAAEMLRLDERSVRERLINGQLKGEKKSVGLREKWFVYSGAVEAALSKQQGSFEGDPIAFTEVTFDGDSAEDVVEEYGTQPRETDDNWIELNRERVKLLAEELVKPLMQKIESQQELIFEQRNELSEKDRQLRLLPDLQKQAEEQARQVELRHVENEALKKQVAAIAEEKARLEMEQLETEALNKQVAALQKQLELAQMPWWKKVYKSGGVQH